MNINIDEYKKRLGENIRFWRERRSISASELARKLDVSLPYISNIEAGRASISIKQINEIAKILNIELTDLIVPCLHIELVREMIKDKNIQEKYQLTDEELRELISIRFHYYPNKEEVIEIIELIKNHSNTCYFPVLTFHKTF